MSEAPSPNSSENKIKILCVDDDTADALPLQMAIETEQDMEFLGVLNRADGLLAEVARLHPDVVLLDLNMPGKDPIAALSEITSAYPQCCVIIFSGFSDSDRVESALSAGAKGFMVKGVDAEEMFALFREQYAKQRSQKLIRKN
jgi:DNA-binding NarL/FixJ family response regulator